MRGNSRNGISAQAVAQSALEALKQWRSLQFAFDNEVVELMHYSELPARWPCQVAARWQHQVGYSLRLDNLNLWCTLQLRMVK